MFKIKKKINFRYFFVLALLLVVMLYFSIVCLKTIILKNIFTLMFVIFLFVMGVLLKKYHNKSIIITISIIIVLLISNLNLTIRQDLSKKYIDYDGEMVVISGRIASELTHTSSGNIKLYIDDISMVNNHKSCKLNKKIVVYVNSTNLDIFNMKVGNRVEIYSTFNAYSFSRKKDIHALSNGTIGYLYVKKSDITIQDKMYFRLDEKIRNYVYTKLNDWNMKYADTAFAMLFGKTAYIEDDINDVFKSTGTTHILAVSGMHISIIIAIIHFIFIKLKFSRKSELIALLIVLPIYNYLCDFSVSVVRASLMGVISSFAFLKHRIYDNLSSLSLSAVIVLLFNPLNLLNYSFILSFSTILIIILLFPCVKRITDKIFYNRFSNAFSLCLSTQIGLVFLQLYLFQSISMLSFFANFVIIPLTTFAFEYLLVVLPILIIIQPLNFLSKIFDYILSVAIKFGSYISNLGLYFTTSQINVIIPILSFILMFIVSDYFFETKKNKLILSLSLIIIGFFAYSLTILPL